MDSLMFNKYIAILGLSLSATYAFATPPTDASIQQAVQLSHANEMAQESINSLKPMFVQQSVQMVQERTGHKVLSEHELDIANQLADVFFQTTQDQLKSINLNTISSELFKKYFTEEELQANIKFLSTPEGQSIQRKTPLMLADMVQQTQAAEQQQMNDPVYMKQLQEKIISIQKKLDAKK